jgi:hypothetical protein
MVDVVLENSIALNKLRMVEALEEYNKKKNKEQNQWFKN